MKLRRYPNPYLTVEDYRIMADTTGPAEDFCGGRDLVVAIVRTVASMLRHPREVYCLFQEESHGL